MDKNVQELNKLKLENTTRCNILTAINELSEKASCERLENILSLNDIYDELVFSCNNEALRDLQFSISKSYKTVNDEESNKDVMVPQYTLTIMCYDLASLAILMTDLKKRKVTGESFPKDVYGRYSDTINLEMLLNGRYGFNAYEISTILNNIPDDMLE